MSDCIFCQIVEGKIPGDVVHQDKECIVIRDIHPAAPVHLLIIPKVHVLDFMDASEVMITKLFSVARKLIKKKNISNKGRKNLYLKKYVTFLNTSSSSNI